MKKLLLITMGAIPTFGFAQNTEGIIIYEETQQIEFKMAGPENEDIKSMMPKTSSTYRQLIFNSEASIYKNYENLEKEDANQMSFSTKEGAMVNIKMKQPDNVIHTDLAGEKVTDKQEFMGKDFIIKEPRKSYPWKLTGESKIILSFNAQKAMFEDTTGITEAWFTTEIPVSIGPGNYGGLPGLILELSVRDGKQVVSATKVNFDPVDVKELEAPKKGKKVTREEYNEIVAEKMKEMKDMYGGNGTFKVIEH